MAEQGDVGLAQRAERGHDGCHAPVQQARIGIDDLFLHARAAAEHGVQARRHGRAHVEHGRVGADAAAMRVQQADVEAARGGDDVGAQLAMRIDHVAVLVQAHADGQAIDFLSAARRIEQDLMRLAHAGQGGGGDAQRFAAGDAGDAFRAGVAAVEFDLGARWQQRQQGGGEDAGAQRPA